MTNKNTVLSPEVTNRISFYEFSTIDKNAVQIIAQLADREVQRFKEKYPDKKDNSPEANAHFDHVSSLVYGSKTVEQALASGNEQSFLIVATEQNIPIAYTVVIVEGDQENKQVKGTFTGVSEAYSKLGIGSELIRLSHMKLRALGISEYVASTWDVSKRMYDSLARKMERSEEEFSAEVLKIGDAEQDIESLQDHIIELKIRLQH